MKTKLNLAHKILAKLHSLLLVCFIATSLMPAKANLPNVKVNKNTYSKMAIDTKSSAIAVLNDTVYTVWQGQPTSSTSNVYFSKSIDGGLTFSTEVNIYQISSLYFHAFASISVSQDAKIHIAWVAVTADEKYNVWYTSSNDGGVRFKEPIVITTSNASVYPCIGTYNNNVYIFYVDAANYPIADYYFVRSTNSGATFGSPIKINDAPCLGDIEFDGVNTIEMDAAGNIYLAWVDGRRAEGKGDIFFAKSMDEGVSFSPNIMVNDINQSGADEVQYLPSLAIEGNNVYVGFTDKRLGSDWTNNRAYLSKSIDGGSTFSSETFLAGHGDYCKHYDLSVSASGKLCVGICAHIPPLWGAWLFESSDGGQNFTTPIALSDSHEYEYSDIQILQMPDNNLGAIWKESIENVDNIYFTRTDIGTKIPKKEMESAYILFPNPSNGTMYIKIKNISEKTDLSIRNLQGLLIYNNLYTNVSNIELDINLDSGLYFVTIKTGKETQTMKLIRK